MRHSDKNVVEAYTELFEGLSFTNKLELIERLSKSIRAESSKKEEDFYKSFGAFSSEKSAEEIINEIKTSRNFRNKHLEL
jgi:uncharacterized protein YjfI (DUF2170 family)